MKTFQLNKLVKDKVFESMEAQGQKVRYRVLDDKEFKVRIKEKILEEAKEFQASGDEKELVDILEAVSAVFDMQKGEIVFADKTVISPFKKRIYVETVTMEDNNEWAAYYESEPGRVPKLK